MKGKMAMIGDGDSVLVFKAVGIDAYAVSGAEEARGLLASLADTHEMIFVTDTLARDMSDVISRYNSSAYPIIIPVPSENGSNGHGYEILRKQTEKALGVDILFNGGKGEIGE